MGDKPKIAFWFRYGFAEHAELFHAMPEILETLSVSRVVHYFGMRNGKEEPPALAEKVRFHHLPLAVRRTSERDKWIKTLLWILSIPWLGLRCRLMGVRAVYMDETIPLTAFLARLFFGRRVAVTVADMFMDIYLTGRLEGLGRAIRTFEIRNWRKLPLIFTRARNTRDWLARQGVPAEAVHPVYDPCDFSVYRPLPPEERAAVRRKMGYADGDVVLVHHGILHPNKGNDLVLRELAALRERLPEVRYLLVGDGPEMGTLKALAEELGLAGICRFTGWLPTLREVNEALNAGDIGLVMRTGRQSDDFHMTGALVHSMACGLAVLGARLGGVSEVVQDGGNGLLFDPHDMRTFGTALERLVRAGPAARHRMGGRAMEDARHLFDIRHVVQATVAPLLELSAPAPRKG
jgi:glycosyltransferase involved in cell wall biosynthesis